MDQLLDRSLITAGIRVIGVHLGFRACKKAPIICMICLEIPGKKPLEFPDLDEFVRHLNREHRFYFWKP